MCFPVEFVKFFRTSFFNKTPPVTSSEVRISLVERQKTLNYIAWGDFFRMWKRLPGLSNSESSRFVVTNLVDNLRKHGAEYLEISKG